jgi:two-component system chemotaxis response regulator CheB
MSANDARLGSSNGRDVVVVGASLGGVEALSRLVAPLPVDWPASLFVVMHTLASRKTLLPEILGRAGRLPASECWRTAACASSTVPR